MAIQEAGRLPWLRRSSKRLQCRKPPRPIHQRRSYDSPLHYELGQMELAELKEAQMQVRARV